MARPKRRPSNELIWALAKVDRTTIRRARRLVWRGTAADDPRTARVAMALAHNAERKGVGVGGAFFLLIFAAVTLSWALAADSPITSQLGRVLAAGVCAYLVAGAAWQQRVACVTAPARSWRTVPSSRPPALRTSRHPSQRRSRSPRSA
jgi:hypothetical protein